MNPHIIRSAMEQIKELTKRLIANSFKELMLQTPFEKITIKMITDHASVIRPTFYNHFHDKYELVEWIIQDEILNEAKRMIGDGKVKDGIDLIFTKFYEDREYYHKAFDIMGQNGFAETLVELLADMFGEAMHVKKSVINDGIITNKVVAKYYANGMITMIHLVISETGEDVLQKVSNAYDYMMSHSIYDLIE